MTPFSNPFMQLPIFGINTGEWESAAGRAPNPWQTPGYGGPLASPDPVKAAAPGLLGKLESALQPYGGMMGVGANLLAQSGQPGTLGGAIGNALLSGRQSVQQGEQNKLRDDYMRAQIEAMRRPEQRQRKLTPVVRDGKVVYEYEDAAVGMEVPQSGGGSTGPSEIEIARALNDPNTPEPIKRDLRMILDRKYRPQAAEPLIAVQTPDGQSMYVPRSQASGMTPAAPREGALPTEGERNSAGYLQRMQAAETLLGDYRPTTTDYAAATALMTRGPLVGSMANSIISPEGQAYYQAASDWVRAKLRKESGAVIGADEMAAEIKTYFPMPGDSDQVIEQKRRSRKQAEQQLGISAGRAAGIGSRGFVERMVPPNQGAAPSATPVLRFDANGNPIK